MSASAPEMGRCRGDGWPLATLCHTYASARILELLPFIRGVHARTFLLLGSPAFICQRMLRDTRWQAAEALKHFRSKCPLSPFPLFSFSFSFFSFCHRPFLFSPVLLFCPSGPFHRQVHVDTHILYIFCTHTHTHTWIAIGSWAKICVCVEPLAPESRSRSLKHCL